MIYYAGAAREITQDREPRPHGQAALSQRRQQPSFNAQASDTPTALTHTPDCVADAILSELQHCAARLLRDPGHRHVRADCHAG